jgi:hypothetical protein
MNLVEYRNHYATLDDAAPGWDALDERLKQVYGQQEPRHWGTIIMHMFGGPDPIDGISAYQCSDGGRDHLHFSTFGYSSLYYDEESVGAEWSGFGFEMTFRLASPLPPPEEPNWVINLLQNLAKYVFKSGKIFEPQHWIPANGPIRQDSDTDLVGLAFVTDPVLGQIDSPHGAVSFVQAFGLTSVEVDDLLKKRRTCEDIVTEQRRSNPLLITDLRRTTHRP